MPKIFDNIEEYLSQALKTTIDLSYKADFCVGYFNLRGWKQLAEKVEKFEGGTDKCCRLLVGMQKTPEEILKQYFATNGEEVIDNANAIRLKKELAKSFREQLIIGTPTEADENALKTLVKQIKNKKVVIKLFLRHPLHAKLYLLYRNDQISPLIGYLGSSNLTLSGLLKQGELNVDVLEQDAALKLSKWFEDRWNDQFCMDISDEIIDIIESSWAAEKLYEPYHVYLKMAYHLAREARAGINEYRLPRVFNDKLFEYQKKAVQIAAHHLHQRNGVIVGDVVGLGKTIIASALAKIFEEDFLFARSLIICPANLVEMWNNYKQEYELKADVISIATVQKILPDLKRYRIVIIDESHNLRNRLSKRYNAIKEYIGLNNSSVILLTATPYNKTYHDLSNQLRLFIDEEENIGVSPDKYIESIGGSSEFNALHQVGIKTISAFEKSDMTDDWRELMRKYMVRRTRSFIRDNYAELDITDSRKYLLMANGERSYFPERIPRKVGYDFKPNDPNDLYAKLYSRKIVDILDELNLPRYGMANYLIKDASVHASSNELNIIENLSRAGKRLMGFARTNLFKRLESSGHAFLLSIIRHILRNYLFIYAIENNLALPIGSPEVSAMIESIDELDIETDISNEWATRIDDDFMKTAEDLYLLFNSTMKQKFDWIKPPLFRKNLLQALKSDCDELKKILKIAKNWNPNEDKQLKALYHLCKKTHKDSKLILFTQFADTAKYIYENLKNWGIDKIELATGESSNPTTLATRFSPVSNGKPEIKNTDSEIRVLISTDVLSEGQNLQDAHIVINYDLPWAIIRLIQRAGRVDRIGQKSEKIICYSFLPEDGLEQIINLRGRLRRRIEENAEVVGSDETFFEGDPVNISDLYNEKAGILDDEDEGEVDLASYAYQIWKNATDENPELNKIVPDLPDVVYATKHEEIADKGVIVYARTYDDNDILALVNNKGELVTTSQLRILKNAACLPGTKPLEKIPNHHELVKKGLDFIKVYESKIGGELGRKTSARYRVYHRLNRYYEDNRETLFATEELKRTIDEIYKYKLREFAKETFNRQLRSGINDQDLADLAVSLRDEGKLVVIEEDEKIKYKEPQIICSLGIK
ncbi:MAG: helicase-related protein [Ignavibacteria bacterium]|jgi:superfamily II DNA or RNA helicase